MTFSSTQRKTYELEQGAVLVTEGKHRNQIGFYCLQNQQLFDMAEIENCPDCHLNQAELKHLAIDVDTNRPLKSPIEYQAGEYCEPHKLALANHEMAVVYWDKPYGAEHSLIHPSKLVPISSVEYARYLKACQISVEQALHDLLANSGFSSSNTSA